MEMQDNYLEDAYELILKLQTPILSFDEICQILAFSIFPRTPVDTVSLFAIDPEATFSAVGSYGTNPTFKSERQKISTTLDLPVSRSIRLDRIIWMEGEVELAREFPIFKEFTIQPRGSTVIAVPIRSMGVPVGALAITGQKLPISENGIKFLELVCLLLGPRMAFKSNDASRSSESPREWLFGHDLTEREYLVQALMAEGRTNARIAAELGYSESTIRQDAMSLFAKLGVNNRIDAGKLFQPRK